MIKTLKHIFYYVVVAMTLNSCANVVSPTGGPKDNIPPIVLSENPVNQSCNFSNNIIHINFDEYVTLDNPNNKILISPPLNEKPEYKLSSKTLSIKFKEDLEAGTTYSINFGEAIKDLHEGNIFKDYVYVFSTGDIIDTLTLEGQVLKGDNQAAVEDIFVMLYKDSNDSIPIDSLPFIVKPNYVSKTNKKGQFKFSGLKEDKYLIFALKDNNSNLIYDLPNEEIAFIDSLIAPDIIRNIIISDSTSYDSTEVVTETHKNSYTLYSFIKEDSVQRLLKKEIVEEGLLRFAFSYPAQDVKIEILEPLADSFNIFKTHSSNYDTILWYFTPNKDSLYLSINYDTLINDTSMMSLKIRKTDRRRKQSDVAKRLNISTNIVGGKLKPEQELILSFKEPITDLKMRDTTWFITSKDTILEGIEFVKIDSFGLRYKLNKKFNPEESYKLIIPDSVFYSFKGTTNDTTEFSFSIPELSSYGNIFVSVEFPDDVPQLVIELLDENDKVQERQIIRESTKIAFKYLSPKKYKLRALLDKDSNARWSPGDFGKKQLPESIIYHKDIFDVKANWDIDLEESWKPSL